MNEYVNIYRLVVFCQLFTCIVCYIHENVKHYIKYYWNYKGYIDTILPIYPFYA